MEIKIRRPQKPEIESILRSGNIRKMLRQFDFFYDFEAFTKRNLPISIKKLVVLIALSVVVTFVTYFTSSYMRATDLDNLEISKQVMFLNLTLWVAYLLFVVGINGLIILVIRAKRIDLGVKNFLTTQTYVAVILFVMMRFVATVLIILDEKLPFELNLNLSFFNFSLLTVLFATQVLLIILSYNYLKLNLGDRIKRYPLLEVLIAVFYTASLWTLTSP